MLQLSTFKCFSILSSNHLNHKCKVFIMLQLGLHVERDGPHTTCNHAKKLKMWLEVNITSAGLRTLGVYYKSPQSLSHSKVTCILAWQLPFIHCDRTRPEGCLRPAHSLLHDFEPSGFVFEYMGVQACPTPWSHCGMLTNAVLSCILLQMMHCTH